MRSVVAGAPPFTSSSKETLERVAEDLRAMYAKCVCRDDLDTAKRELGLHRREHVAWERDTVWRTMIGQARRGGELVGHPTLVHEPGQSAALQVGRVRITKNAVAVVVATTVGVVLANVHVVDEVPANRCLAVLVFATIMWATEAIPLFVTSMLVPLLLVTMRVIRDATSGEQLSTPAATKYARR